MDADQMLVGGEPDIALQAIRAVFQRLYVRAESVLRPGLGSPPMCDHARSCEGEAAGRGGYRLTA
jgi:hypothetical protein